MLSAPFRLFMRASAAADARSAASVADVWAVLVHPARWPEFEPLVVSVTGVDTELDADIPVHVGQQLRGLFRMSTFDFPIVVDHMVTASSLVVTAHLLPGLTEEVEHLLIPSASGGSQLTVRIALSGPLALPAIVPRWLLRNLTVRLLARAAESELRVRDRQVSSVA